jgi:lysophospholipase L1-like esterase
MKIKELLFAVLVCLTSLIAKGQNTRYDTIRYAREYYQERVTLFNGQPVQKASVIILGNSIVEFGDWQKLLNDPGIINRGIGGDNTFGVLDRLEDVIIRHPDKLFIEIGINDISQDIPVEIVVNNIFTIVDRVKAKLPETKIYVHSILPTNDNVKNEYPAAFNKNEQSMLVNQQLKRNAKERMFTYIDLRSVLSDKNGKLDVKYADPDGLHLNQTGYETWVKLLKTKKIL